MGAEISIPRKHTTRGIICAMLGALCWGFSGTCAQLLMDTYGAPSDWITASRMLFSALFFLAVAAVRERSALGAVLRDRRSLVSIALYALFGILLTQLSYLNVIHYTSAGVGTTIEQLGLALILLYSCWRARRLPTFREAAGLVFALGGLVFIATQGDLGKLMVPPEGLAWGLIAAVALALYTLMPVRVLSKWGAMIVTGFAMLFGGVVASAVAPPWQVPIELSPGSIGAFAAIVLIGTCAAYMLFLQGVNDCGPVKAGLLCAGEPVSAMILATVWLHTPVTVWDIMGCACILVMIVLVTEISPKKKPATTASPGAASAASSSEESVEGIELAPDPPMFAGRASVLGYYSARVATVADFNRITALLELGHETAAELGIAEGRAKKYPSPRRLMHSVRNGTTHVIEDSEGHLIGVFAVSFSPDKIYARGIDGAWLTDTTADPQPYAELHWVVVDKPARRRGVGRFILDRADEIAREGGRSSIRADIYPDNEPMRWLLERHGYRFCGTITVRNSFGAEKKRSAFERVLRRVDQR